MISAVAVGLVELASSLGALRNDYHADVDPDHGDGERKGDNGIQPDISRVQF